MERSLFSTIIRGLVGITTLGSLAIVSSIPGSSSSAAPPQNEGGWRLLDPVTYENIPPSFPSSPRPNTIPVRF